MWPYLHLISTLSDLSWCTCLAINALAGWLKQKKSFTGSRGYSLSKRGSDNIPRYFPSLSLVLCSADHFQAPTASGTHTPSFHLHPSEKECLPLQACQFPPCSLETLWLVQGVITVVRGMWCSDWSGPNHMLHAPPHQLCDGVQSLARTQSACWSQRSGYLWEWGQKWLRGHRASSRRAGNVLYLDLGLPTRVHTYTNTHWIETSVVQASR